MLNASTPPDHADDYRHFYPPSDTIRWATQTPRTEPRRTMRCIVRLGPHQHHGRRHRAPTPRPVTTGLLLTRSVLRSGRPSSHREALLSPWQLPRPTSIGSGRGDDWSRGSTCREGVCITQPFMRRVSQRDQRVEKGRPGGGGQARQSSSSSGGGPTSACRRTAYNLAHVVFHTFCDVTTPGGVVSLPPSTCPLVAPLSYRPATRGHHTPVGVSTAGV